MNSENNSNSFNKKWQHLHHSQFSTPAAPTTVLVTLDNFEQHRAMMKETIIKKMLVWKICKKCASFTTPEQIVQFIYNSHTKYTKEWEKLQRMIRLCRQQHSAMITASQLYQQSVIVGYYSHMAAAFRFCRWKSPNQLMDLIEHYGSSWMVDQQQRMDRMEERWMRRRQIRQLQQQYGRAPTPPPAQMNNGGYDDNKRMQLS
jgi:hypothetical protein